jgi:prefoldin subunit 5
MADTDPKALAAELQILASELEELTQAVERSSPAQIEPGQYRTAAA